MVSNSITKKLWPNLRGSTGSEQEEEENQLTIAHTGLPKQWHVCILQLVEKYEHFFDS